MTGDTIQRNITRLRGDSRVALSPRTRATYLSHWTGFEAWCEENGRDALPADSDSVVGYLMSRFEAGKAIATIRTARQAIASKHNLKGLDHPCGAKDVRDVVRMLTRKASRQGRGVQKQAPAIRLDDIALYEQTGKPSDIERSGPHGVLWTAKMERDYRGALALLYVMHSALMRRSEAAAATWADLKPVDGGRAVLTIPKSKTSDQPMHRLLTSRAVRHLEAIRPKGCQPTDRLFGAKTGRTIQNRITRAVGRIVPGCTGHSLRVGAAQDLTARGASLQEVRNAGGWKSLHMVARYAEAIRPELGAVLLLED